MPLREEDEQLTSLLVDNAIKYCDDGGTIKVELARSRNADISFIVGGAVVDETFAKSIGAVYGNTPMDSVRAAEKLSGR